MSALDKHLQELGITVIEGYSHQNPKQVETLRKIASDENIKSVLEIGFNAGHSSEIFLSSNAAAHVLSFDLGIHDYVAPAKRFLDEKRFVEAYVHGKFAIKGWGVNKIKAGLRAHKIHETLISFGLTQLETEATKKVLEQWLSKKRQALRNEPESPKKNAKIIRFLLTKGFEMDQILSLIRPF
jgi:hypothetical protein